MVNQITPIYFTKNNEIRPHKRSEHTKNIGKSTVRARCISSPSPRLVPSRLVYPYLMKIHPSTGSHCFPGGSHDRFNPLVASVTRRLSLHPSR